MNGRRYNPPANARRWPGCVPYRPFRRWVNELLERHGGERQIVAWYLGVNERTVYRWSRGLGGSNQPTLLIAFMTVVEALHAGDGSFEDLYPGYCSSCGRKKTSGGKTGLCQECYVAGPNRRPHRSRPRNVSEATLSRAREMYERGLSIREVAKELFPQTAYANERSFASCLFQQAKRRGWKLRSQSAATVAANKHKHNRHLPRCPFIRADGSRCDRRSQYAWCDKHEPAAIAAGLLRLRGGDVEGVAATLRRIAERQRRGRK